MQLEARRGAWIFCWWGRWRGVAAQVLGTGAGDGTLDRLVASSPWGHPSRRQFPCTLRCHMSQLSESHENVTAQAQQLKEQG